MTAPVLAAFLFQRKPQVPIFFRLVWPQRRLIWNNFHLSVKPNQEPSDWQARALTSTPLQHTLSYCWGPLDIYAMIFIYTKIWWKKNNELYILLYGSYIINEMCSAVSGLYIPQTLIVYIKQIFLTLELVSPVSVDDEVSKNNRQMSKYYYVLYGIHYYNQHILISSDSKNTKILFSFLSCER